MSESHPPDPERVVHGLDENPLLKHLSDAERRVLAGFLEEQHFPAGATVVREGERDRAMYFVLSGVGRIVRGSMDLGPLRRGEHFGELGLVADRPRAATIVAQSPLELAKLSLESYDALSREQPELALGLLKAFVDGVADRLVEMTESVGLLLATRSLPRRAKLQVDLGDRRVEVRTGTPADELLPTRVDGHNVVAALVDKKPVILRTPLSSSCRLEPLTDAHWEGQRILRQSLALLLLEAAGAVAPALTFSMEHSVGFGQRVAVAGDGVPPLEQLARDVQHAMQRLVADNRVLREELWTAVEARDYFAQRGMNEASSLLSIWRDPTVPLVSYGQVYALSPGPLLPETGKLGGFQLLGDADGLLLVYGPRARSIAPLPNVASDTPPESTQMRRAALEVARQTRHMTQAQDLWLATLGVRNVGEFNDACVRGSVSQLIRVSEGFQEKNIGRIADAIRDSAGAVKLVCIAGPSSSGKTTFIKRLRVQLQVNGIRPLGISLDDYYVDRDQSPRDAWGEYDFEALEALRVEALQGELSRLLAGERVKTARYDFQSGKSLPGEGPELELSGGDVLMLEGIHGLNPKLLGMIPEAQVFRVFVCPLAQLPFDRMSRVHASDVRLIRRIVRDRHGRGYSAADNIQRWPSVRAGERRHIFPFQHHADAVFDTSLLYELSVLKVFAERYLLEVPQDHAAYTTAFRLLALLDRFVTIYPDHVPPTSILREFIGGSGFEY